MSRFFSLLSRYPKTVVLFTLALSAFFLFSMRRGMFNRDGRLILDTTLEPIISRESDAFEFFQEMQKTFGKSDIVVIAFKKEHGATFNAAFLREYHALAKRIKKEVPGIEDVITITTLPSLDNMLNLLHPCQGKSYFHVASGPGFRAACVDLLAAHPSLQADAQLNKRIKTILPMLVANPFSAKNLISEDRSTVAQIIFFSAHSNPSDSTVQEPLMRLIQGFSLKGFRVGYAGLSRVQYEASNTIKSDLGFILPLSLLLMVVVLAFSFRSVRGVLIPFAVILTGILWTAGIFALLGYELNLMTIVLPPLLVSVGSAYVIHLLHQYYFESRSGGDFIARTVHALTTPLVVTALTTIAGFAAITISPIPAIKEMGLFACVGIAVIIFLSLTFAPALLSFMTPPRIRSRKQGRGLLDRILARLSTLIAAHSKRFIAFWMILGLGAFAGIYRLSVDSNPKTFDESSPIGSDLALIQDNLAGTTMLTVVLSPKEGHTLTELSTIRALRRLNAWLLSDDERVKGIDGIRIDKVYSVQDILDVYLKFKGAAFASIKPEELAFLMGKLNHLPGPKYLSKDGKYMQFLIRMKLDSSAAFLALREEILKESAALLPHLKMRFTGVSVLTSESADSIAKGQIRSLLLALGAIFFILSLLFFSPKMGLIALYPNIVSIAVFFGLLGWASIPLGVTVSVIASIALGIGVDNTIHFLNHFNEVVKKNRCEKDASSAALQHVGKPMIYTTITLAIGFGMFALSAMESQVLFGALTAFTLVVCLVTALSFLPAIMIETRLITAWDYLALEYDRSFIRSIDIFQNMHLRETKIASLLAYTVDLQEGELLFRAKEEGTELYVILDGSIKLFLDKEDDEVEGVITVLSKGQSFGEMALFRKTHRTASAVATSHTKLLVITEEVLQRLKRRSPAIATKLFLNLAAKLWEAITSANPTIVDITDNIGESTMTQEIRLEQVMERVRSERRISHTGKANLEEVLKRVARHKEEIHQLLAMTEEGDIDLENPIRHSIWNRFTEAQIQWMKGHFQKKEVENGEVLLREGESGDWFGIVLSGTFIVTLSNANRRTIVATVHEGELVGEASILGQGAIHSATVTAVEPSSLLILSREQTLQFSKRHPKLAAELTFNMVSLLSDRLEHMLVTIHH